jgi:heme-degrading monooxygenase HmoA
LFARTGFYEFPEDQRDESIEAFREALGQISDCEGFQRGWYLVSPEGGRGLTITFWDSRASMEASRVKASRLRSEAAGKADGGVVSAEEFEVAFQQTPGLVESSPG